MLSEDLISEVLVRLPVKSLLRFRCVCKDWCRLIKSRNFIDMHLQYSKTKPDCILLTPSSRDRNKSLIVRDYESLDPIDEIQIKIPGLNFMNIVYSEPCNGLLCFLYSGTEFVLYNPAIRDYKHLPPCPFPCRKGFKYYVVGFGLGFATNPNDYKVVSFVRKLSEYDDDDNRLLDKDDDEDNSENNSEGDEAKTEDHDDINVNNDDHKEISHEYSDHSESDKEYTGDNIEGNGSVNNEAIVDNEDGKDSESDDGEPVNKLKIYNLSTNSWRKIKCDCPEFYDGGDQYGTLLNGALHWTAHRKGKDTIVVFDMSTEVLHDMELPGELNQILGINRSLTVLNDCLALFYILLNYPLDEIVVEIWVMKEYGVAESWTRQFSVGPLSGFTYPLKVWKDKAILESDGHLISCALDTHEIDQICSILGVIKFMFFQESLISPV